MLRQLSRHSNILGVARIRSASRVGVPNFNFAAMSSASMTGKRARSEDTLFGRGLEAKTLGGETVTLDSLKVSTPAWGLRAERWD